MLNIRATDGLRLFHLVDKYWDGNGYVFTFRPGVESQARSMITGLSVYLLWLAKDHPMKQDAIAGFIIAAAMERA